MIILSLSVLLYYLQFVSSLGVFYNSGFKYLTERVLQIVANADISATKTRWITQPINHFNESSDTWKMRYYENLVFFRPKGPIYIFLGGEGEADPGFLSTGVVHKMAQETNGAMFMTEHRYYGKSKPFDDLNVDNMKWLTSRQALADVANLIKSIKSTPLLMKSKVVIVGGSYSGNLAAWMRLLYSNLVDAAIASSGPVLAKKDFFEYIEKVNEDYELYGTTECLDTVRNMFTEYKKKLQSSDGVEDIKNKFGICPQSNLSIIENQWVFFTYLTDRFMENSQYGGAKKIEEHCSKLEAPMPSIFSNSLFWNKRSNCVDVSFNTMIEELKNESWAYSWFYQVCTEFGYFQTTSSDSQPFGQVLPLEYFIKSCQALYGPDFDEDRVDKAIENTNKFYGGLKPNVTRVVFVNGDMDPWSTISVLEDISYETPAVVIHRVTHCADLFADRHDASEELKEASKHIKNLVKNWIGVGNDSVQSY